MYYRNAWKNRKKTQDRQINKADRERQRRTVIYTEIKRERETDGKTDIGMDRLYNMHTDRGRTRTGSNEKGYVNPKGPQTPRQQSRKSTREEMP